MSISGAQLASTATTVEELTTRISRAADAFAEDGDETTAGELYDVERSLAAASRRLSTVVRRLNA